MGKGGDEEKGTCPKGAGAIPESGELGHDMLKGG